MATCRRICPVGGSRVASGRRHVRRAVSRKTLDGRATQSMLDEVTLGGRSIPRGVRATARIPLAIALDGGELGVWVHIVRGAQPRPTLTIVSGLHGDEWFLVETLRRLVGSTQASR